MVNQEAGKSNLEMISTVKILSALSDDKAFTIYNTILLDDRQDFRALIKHMGITPHQLYSRLLKLTNAGLIRRENRRYVTTHLGIVVYKAISLVGTGLKYYWVLKVIESLQTSAAINSNEVISKLVDSLIDDHDIKKIVMERLLLLLKCSLDHRKGQALYDDSSISTRDNAVSVITEG